MSPAEICRVHFSKPLGSFVADLENAAIKDGLSTHHRDIMARVMIVFGKEGPTVARLQGKLRPGRQPMLDLYRLSAINREVSPEDSHCFRFPGR